MGTNNLTTRAQEVHHAISFFLLQLRPLKRNKEHVMKSKAVFYLILLTFFASLVPAMHAQTFSVIHSFSGGTDVGFPTAGVTIQGNALYGTSYSNVFQMTRSGSNWLYSNLAALSGPIEARAVFGPDDHPYSTSVGGNGIVFTLTPRVGPCRDAACYWNVSVLHEFSSGTDGWWPTGDLIWDQQGNIYGTTIYGGTWNGGTVYELTPSANGYTEQVIYSFAQGYDGSNPTAGVIFNNKSELFGTTANGGPNGPGSVFKLTYVPGTGWTKQVLYGFHGTDDGAFPYGGVIFDSAGNLYGTTTSGGSGCGTFFELSPSGDSWTFKLLYSFPGHCGSYAPLRMDAAGNLYGTGNGGGIYGYGSVFKLSNTQNGWVYTSLHDFTGGSDGGYPQSNVSIDIDGTLYGTADGVAGNGRGAVWMIKP